VLHPPGYHLGAALVDLLLWHKVSVTRLTGIRYYSAALGALTIFFAWLLAAQVLAREWQQLAAAALAATQPILAFSASTITNDVAVALTLTAALAWCAWMLRGPPRSRQGIGLGLLLAAAFFTKATSLSLVFVVVAMLWLMWRTYPDAKREIVGVAKWAVAVPAVLVGWWYVYLLIVTHSILGEEGSLTSGAIQGGGGVLNGPAIAWNWISQVYRGYWFDYLPYEVHATDVWFWVPLIGIGIVFAGFILFVRRGWGTLTAPESPELRQVLLLVLVAVVLVVPPLALDTLRGIRGLKFETDQGRFLTPAYPGLAVIAVIAVRELCSRRPRALAVALGAGVAGAFVFYWHTWVVWVLERFYGPIDGHWLRALYHASYDKPTFVTQTSLAAIWVTALALFVAAVAVVVRGAWPRQGSPQERDDRAPIDTQHQRDQRLAPGAAEVG
jgi:4-amino-4-deoxy-L-arabinose transferase-like glycosyltransferase